MLKGAQAETPIKAASMACLAGCGAPEAADLPVKTESGYVTTDA